MHSSVVGHLGCFHSLAIANTAAINIGMQVPFLLPDSRSLRYIPRRRIAESYGRSISSFVRRLHTVFHNGCTSLHSHQQCMSVLFPQHPCQILRWNLSVVLIYISFMARDGEHFFMCFLAIWTSPIEKVLFRSVAHFFIGSLIFFFFWNLAF
jgi:hypothetical protein